MYQNLSRSKQRNKEKTELLLGFFFMVRVGRLELPASCSQSRRATNCATPGYTLFASLAAIACFARPPSCLPIPGHPLPANRDTSSKPPRFFRHRRRFGAFPKAFRATNCATPGYTFFHALRYKHGMNSYEHSYPILFILTHLYSKIRRPSGRRIYYNSFSLRLQVVYRPKAALRASTRSVCSQRTFRSSRPI